MSIDGRDHRGFVPGDTGDQRRARHLAAVQLVHPDGREFFGLGGRKLPAKLLGGGFERESRFLRDQGREEAMREKMQVCIGNR